MRKLAIAPVSLVLPVFLVSLVLFLAGDSLAKGKPPHARKHEVAKEHRHAHISHDKSHHKGHKKHYKAHRKAHRKALREVAHWHGGPPPWAPAHGYRRGRRAEVNYAVPFGIATGTCNQAALGAALGAAGGGLIGAEVSGGDSRAIFGGLLAGALLGGALADAVAGPDRNCFGQALEHAPSRETIAWRNPDQDTSYQFTPTRTYETDGGRYCREYTTSVTIGGREESAYGTACRQPDGSWEPIRQPS